MKKRRVHALFFVITAPLLLFALIAALQGWGTSRCTMSEQSFIIE